MIPASETASRKKTLLNPVLGENIDKISRVPSLPAELGCQRSPCECAAGFCLEKRCQHIHQLFHDQRHRNSEKPVPRYAAGLGFGLEILGTTKSCPTTCGTETSSTCSRMLQEVRLSMTCSAVRCCTRSSGTNFSAGTWAISMTIRSVCGQCCCCLGAGGCVGSWCFSAELSSQTTNCNKSMFANQSATD